MLTISNCTANQSWSLSEQMFPNHQARRGIVWRPTKLLTSLLMKKINDSCTEKWFVFSRLPVSKLAAFIYFRSITRLKTVTTLFRTYKTVMKIFCLCVSVQFWTSQRCPKIQRTIWGSSSESLQLPSSKISILECPMKKIKNFIMWLGNRIHFYVQFFC